MNNLPEILERLTISQRAAYELISGTKYFRAEGAKIKTFRSLAKLGLIKLNPDSAIKHDYVISMEPPKKQKKVKVPLTKDVIKNIIEKSTVSQPLPDVVETPELKHKPCTRLNSRPSADHTNVSREDYVRKWLAAPVEVTGKAMIKVKCLTDVQMEYIMAHHHQQSAQAMAEYLKVEKYRVILFCQANDIEPVQEKKRKPKDDFHCIPPERLQRMKRADYNGPQKKTA